MFVSYSVSQFRIRKDLFSVAWVGHCSIVEPQGLENNKTSSLHNVSIKSTRVAILHFLNFYRCITYFHAYGIFAPRYSNNISTEKAQFIVDSIAW